MSLQVVMVEVTSEFAITAATSLQERRTRTLKNGDTFAVFDANGDIAPDEGGAEGLYHRDTRHLSRFALTLHDARPLLLSSTLRDDNAALICDLTNPDLVGRRRQSRSSTTCIHLRRSKFLYDGICFERISVRNFAAAAAGADAANSRFDRRFRRSVRGARQPPRAARRICMRRRSAPTCVTLAYTGLDDESGAARGCASIPCRRGSSSDRAQFDLDLAPTGHRRHLCRGTLRRRTCRPAGRAISSSPPRSTRGAPARQRLARGRGRDLERGVQRSAPPLDLRPHDAGDGDRRRGLIPMPACRGSAPPSGATR